jgi:hypothetical protein
MPNTQRQHRLRRRVQSIRHRISSLEGLRKLVVLSPRTDISSRQWAVIQPQLVVASQRLAERVRRASQALLPQASDPRARRELSAALGQIELDMARSFTFFDTYMDVLTQRQSAELGGVLAGCDVLALDAIRRDHPALELVEAPLVYCERGIGAAIARESVPFPDGSPNPMPLIQIPYARLGEKHNLTSILHEVGHQALHRLQLIGPISRVLQSAVTRAGGSSTLADLYGLWSSEIGPDFWAFGLAGPAEAAAVCDLFALPPAHALRIAGTDPHPPPYIRALLCLDWCRRAWGQGPWDEWQAGWLELYRLDAVAPTTARLIVEARRHVPTIGAALFDARFTTLGGRRLLDLLDLEAVAPDRLRRASDSSRAGKIDLRGLKPSAQLAAFRMIREWAPIPEEQLDALMAAWLIRLGARRRALH